MHIRELRLHTHQLDGQRTFYAETLGLPLVDEGAQHVTFGAGSTRLTFAASDAPTFYHFAFNIPSDQFAEAKAWAQARMMLIPHTDGSTSFMSSPHWDAEILYFYDRDGNIVEFIARHRLGDHASAPFSAANIRCVSEIGLVVADVRASVVTLTETLSINAFDGDGSDTFTAVGDEQGLFIVVREGRAWYPTVDQFARPAPVWARLDDADFTFDGGKIRIDKI